MPESSARYYCTYFDSNYLMKGLTLLRSLIRHERGHCGVFVVCMDEMTEAILKGLQLPGVILIPMAALEREDKALLSAKEKRSIVEYYWTCTPVVIKWVIEKFPQVDVLTYLDADLFFFSSPQPIFEEFAGGSVMIHEHRFPPELRYLEKYGKYNVGLLSFRRDGNGMRVLNVWREQCLEWCRTVFEEGKFGDQAYLDDWPVRFNGVKILKHVGAGLAPWNHSQYRIERNSLGLVMVDSLPLVFYHFHRFFHILPEVHIPVACELYKLPLSVIKLCVQPYIAAILESFREIRAVAPDFSRGFEPKRTVESALSFLAHNSVVEAVRRSRPPHKEVALDHEWVLFASPQFEGA